jgi:hypothetical protein
MYGRFGFRASCLRFGLCLFALVNAYGVDQARADLLWPTAGQTQAWVQFANGAWGQITAMGETSSNVTFWDSRAGVQRTVAYANVDITNGARGAPRWVGQVGPAIAPSKWARFAPWARAAGVGVGVAGNVVAVIYPDELGDGSLDAHCEGNQTCLETGFPPCDVLPGCGTYGWVNVPCAQASGGAISVRVESSPGTYCPMESYPEDTGWGWLLNVLPSEAGTIWDQLPLPDTLTEQQQEDLAGGATGLWDHELGQPGPFNPGAGVIPDIWDPIPMPPGFEDHSAIEMNPGGYPQNGEGVISDPQAQPPLIAWPQDDEGDTWPQDHPAPSSTFLPNGNPQGEIVPGDPLEGVELTVNFPDQMDVEVQNWPETPFSEVDGELETVEVDFGSLSWDSGWLPSECPPPMQADLYGSTLEIPYDSVCTMAQGISGFLVALSLITGGMYALRGI